MKSISITLPFLTTVLATAPNPGPKWVKTLLLDDFTGGQGAPPLSSNWILRTGTSYPGGAEHWGTNEIETYTSSSQNVGQSGTGNLLITPVKDSSGQWTSARVESVLSNFTCPAGGRLKMEARISLPAVTPANGLGYWSAFWALGGGLRKNVTDWPAVGEIDIMESVNGENATTPALHCGTAPGGPCNEYSGLYLPSGTPCPGSSCAGNFHTYRLIVDRTVAPETMTWYVDDIQKFQITQNTLGNTWWNKTVYHGYYLVLNVAMGGNLPNIHNGENYTPTNKTVSGKSMAVDYVAVWATK